MTILRLLFICTYVFILTGNRKLPDQRSVRPFIYSPSSLCWFAIPQFLMGSSDSQVYHAGTVKLYTMKRDPQIMKHRALLPVWSRRVRREREKNWRERLWKGENLVSKYKQLLWVEKGEASRLANLQPLESKQTKKPNASGGGAPESLLWRFSSLSLGLQLNHPLTQG